MRAIHLLGLPGPDGEPIRFQRRSRVPLMLPGFIRAEDQELVIGFYQQVITGSPLPRVEIDWHQGLLPAGRQYLEDRLDRLGASGFLLVVRIMEATAKVDEIVRESTLQRVEHLVLSSAFPIRDQNLATLVELTKLVEERVDDLYQQMAESLPLRADGWKELDGFVQTLLNPAAVLETWNAAVEVQLERVVAEAQHDTVIRRMMQQLLERRSAEELVGLVALATRDRAALQDLVGVDEAGRIIDGLRGQLLVVDDRLSRWAAFLRQSYVLEGLFGPSSRIPTRAQRTFGWAERVDQVILWTGAPKPEPKPLDETKPMEADLRRDIYSAMALVYEGKLGRAQELLDTIEPLLSQHSTRLQADWWDAVGRLRSVEGRWAEAENALRQAVRLLRDGGATPTRQAVTLDVLARALRDAGRWEEAEPAFREALRLMEEGGGTATGRGITLGELARGLQGAGRWAEAESAFREALRLMEEGGATATNRGITLGELARGLRDAGRWAEAEPTFRETLRLKEEGGDTATSRGITLHELACGLRDVGRWAEAESAFREALRLAEEGGDTPISRAITLEELAKGLRQAGRSEEAEATFRQASHLRHLDGTSVTKP